MDCVVASARVNASAAASDTPWGWPGNDNKIRKREPKKNAEHAKQAVGQVAKPSKNKKPMVGWPYREDNFDLSGNTYKVTRKAKPEKTATRGRLDKPWGW